MKIIYKQYKMRTTHVQTLLQKIYLNTTILAKLNHTAFLDQELIPYAQNPLDTFPRLASL